MFSRICLQYFGISEILEFLDIQECWLNVLENIVESCDLRWTENSFNPIWKHNGNF